MTLALMFQDGRLMMYNQKDKVAKQDNLAKVVKLPRGFLSVDSVKGDSFLEPVATNFSFIYEMLRLAIGGRIGGLSSYGQLVLLSTNLTTNLTWGGV